MWEVDVLGLENVILRCKVKSELKGVIYLVSNPKIDVMERGLIDFTDSGEKRDIRRSASFCVMLPVEE